MIDLYVRTGFLRILDVDCDEEDGVAWTASSSPTGERDVVCSAEENGMEIGLRDPTTVVEHGSMLSLDLCRCDDEE